MGVGWLVSPAPWVIMNYYNTHITTGGIIITMCRGMHGPQRMKPGDSDTATLVLVLPAAQTLNEISHNSIYGHLLQTCMVPIWFMNVVDEPLGYPSNATTKLALVVASRDPLSFSNINIWKLKCWFLHLNDLPVGLSCIACLKVTLTIQFLHLSPSVEIRWLHLRVLRRWDGHQDGGPGDFWQEVLPRRHVEPLGLLHSGGWVSYAVTHTHT